MYLLQRNENANSTTGPEGYHGITLVPVSSDGVVVLTINAVLLTLAIIWTFLRLYSRRIMGFGLMIEDYFHLCALFSFFGLSIVTTLMVVVGGFGHHNHDLGRPVIALSLKLGFASQVLYILTLGLVKISICAMLTRIFEKPFFILIARVLVTLSCSWMATGILLGFLICHPVEANWNPMLYGAQCGDQTMAFAAVGAADVITDLLILLVPIPILMKLRLPRRNKIGLLAIFCMGVLTMAFGLTRVILLFDVTFQDFNYSGKTLHIITISEAAVSLMVASSPMLRPLVDQVLQGSLYSFSDSSDDTSKSHCSQSSDTTDGSNTLNSSRFSRLSKTRSQGFAVMDDNDLALTPVPVNQYLTKIEAVPLHVVNHNG